MISCPYCGTNYVSYRSKCEKCGGTITPERVAAKTPSATKTTAGPTNAGTAFPPSLTRGVATSAPSRKGLNFGCVFTTIMFLVIAAAIVGLVGHALLFGGSLTTRTQEVSNSVQSAQAAFTNQRETQEAAIQLTREAERHRVDEESQLIVDSPGQIVSFRRLPGEGLNGLAIPGINCGPGFGLDQLCAARTYGEFEVTNIGRYVTLRIYNSGADECVVPLRAGQALYELHPGEKVLVYCLEYEEVTKTGFSPVEGVFLTLYVDLPTGPGLYQTEHVRVPVTR